MIESVDIQSLTDIQEPPSGKEIRLTPILDHVLREG